MLFYFKKENVRHEWRKSKNGQYITNQLKKNKKKTLAFRTSFKINLQY